MMRNNALDPFKVINWNSPDKPEKRKQIVLSMGIDGHMMDISHTIDGEGNITTNFDQLCSLP